MKSKSELIANEALKYSPNKVVDIGYAQAPNDFLRGTKVYGVDIVERPSPYEKNFLCDLNTEPLPFTNEEVDVVTMGCTLAHVANPLKTLSEINRILKAGGILILSSPNPNYYWENVLNIFYNFFKKRVSKAKHEEHFFEFSRYNIRTIGARSGFDVLKEIGVSFHIVKTSIKFNPTTKPGIAYEIIYILKKSNTPSSYATFENSEGIQRIPTTLFK